MIAYFDTSALIPLIVEEPPSDTCSRLWNEATRTISSRLIYPEARAALAQAERMRRLSAPELVAAVKELDLLALEIDYLEITANVTESAAALAQAQPLRGYDAVHLHLRRWRPTTNSSSSPVTATSGPQQDRSASPSHSQLFDGTTSCSNP